MMMHGGGTQVKENTVHSDEKIKTGTDEVGSQGGPCLLRELVEKYLFKE